MTLLGARGVPTPPIRANPLKGKTLSAETEKQRQVHLPSYCDDPSQSAMATA